MFVPPTLPYPSVHFSGTTISFRRGGRFQQGTLRGDPAGQDVTSGWVVNTFPDRKLSDTDRVPAIPLLEPLARTQVTESLLHPLRVVEALDVSEHRLPGLFPRMEMNPVDRFFLQN